jgi:hypothetical protein
MMCVFNQVISSIYEYYMKYIANDLIETESHLRLTIKF